VGQAPPVLRAVPHREKYFLPPSIAAVTSMEDDPQSGVTGRNQREGG